MTTTDATAPPSKAPFPWAASPAARAGMLLALLAVMQIPLLMVAGLISERQDRHNEVLNDFRRGWGLAQSLTGPILAVPFVAPVPNATVPGQTERRWVRIPPTQLSVAATMQPETRRRGLFHAVVYTANVELSGTITVPAIDLSDTPSAELLWNEAVLVTSAADLRGQPADGMMEVDGHRVRLEIQSTKASCGGIARAAADLSGSHQEGTKIPFRGSIVLRGTQSLNLLPEARQTELQITAPWRNPGFTGSALPVNHDVDRAGFHATWRIAGDAASAGRGFATRPSPLCLTGEAHDSQILGVDLLEPMPTYVMVDRASKYGTLFLALSFLTYFIFETVSRARIHLAQYALLGLSVSLFALLLIALAEPLGFTIGYVLSTIAVMGQASLYTLSVVGSARLAAMFAGVLGLLFGFLYVVISLETWSLLVGTLALFAALSVVMTITRHLDWSGRGAAIAQTIS